MTDDDIELDDDELLTDVNCKSISSPKVIYSTVLKKKITCLMTNVFTAMSHLDESIINQCMTNLTQTDDQDFI